MLDADGVINTRPGSLDEDKLGLVAKIVRETHCQVIISSSWRTVPHMLERLQKALFDWGVWVSGVTPDLSTKEGELWKGAERWAEIQLYVDDYEGLISEVAILDDEDMGPLNGFLVRTDPAVGLTEKLAAEVIRRLNKPL